MIVRRDGRPTYNFAVVVDDAAMGIDKVLRGDDHLSNTPRQVLIFDALGYLRPEFTHLPTVRGLDGARLSKRHGAASVSEFRQAPLVHSVIVRTDDQGGVPVYLEGFQDCQCLPSYLL